MHSRADGQATLELALLLPVVAVLLGVLFETGMIASDQVRLWHAAREAARIAAVDGDLGSIRAATDAADLDDVVVNVAPSFDGRRAGEQVTVSLRYDPAPRVPLVGDLFGGVRLGAEITARIEQP